MKRNQERDWTVTFRIYVAGWKIPVVLELGEGKVGVCDFLESRSLLGLHGEVGCLRGHPGSVQWDSPRLPVRSPSGGPSQPV